MYGLLLASVAAGAFVASLASGWTTRVVHQGRAVLWAVTAWGITIAVAGLTTQIWLVLLMLAGTGAADMISGVYRSTIAAAVTPDEMRGRVSGVEIAVYAGGPVLGDVEAGVVGGLVGVPFAIVSGGLACVAAAGYFAVKVRSSRPTSSQAHASQVRRTRESGRSRSGEANECGVLEEAVAVLRDLQRAAAEQRAQLGRQRLALPLQCLVAPARDEPDRMGARRRPRSATPEANAFGSAFALRSS